MGEAGVCGRLFGTDGVRGVAGQDLTARLAMDLERGRRRRPRPRPGRHGPSAGRPVAVIGRDPRASGEFLEAAVVAGLASAGVDVLRLGVMPTPGVAYLAGALGADFGVVISASHNPARDNGIKFFGRGGVKLPDAVEDQIEARLERRRGANANTARRPRTSAGSRDAGAEQERYVDHLLSTLPARPRLPLAGPAGGSRLRARGGVPGRAARRCAARARRSSRSAPSPTAQNINAGCGSTSPGGPGRGGGRPTAPTPAWPMTVTPTGAWPSMRTGSPRRRPDPGRARHRAEGCRKAGRRRRGGHGDVEPGLPRGHARRRHPGDRDPGRRQARLRGHAGRRLRTRRRAVRAHHLARARQHRRRRADQPAVPGRGEPPRGLRGRGGHDDAQVPAGAPQRARRGRRSSGPGSPRRSPGRRKPARRRRAGSWSGRAAPSPRSG